MLFVISLVPALKQQFNKIINVKSQTNRDQKSNLLFLHNIINLKTFESNLLKIDKNHYKGIDIYFFEYITLKKLVIVKKLIIV